KNRLRTQIVRPIKTIHRLEDLFFAQAGIFKGALLKSVLFDEVGFVFFDEPAVLPGHLIKLSARIRCSQRNLDTKHIEFLREADGILDGLLRLDWQPKDESAVDDYTGLVARFGEASHFVHGHALLDSGQYLFVAALISNE